MRDIYLRFPSEEVATEELSVIKSLDDIFIDVIGIIYKPVNGRPPLPEPEIEDIITTETEEGTVVTVIMKSVEDTYDPNQEMIEVDGWHVNLRVRTEEALVNISNIVDKYSVNPPPKRPVRVWL